MFRGDSGRRRAAGRACKRLLDLGRLRFLESIGWAGEVGHGKG